MKDRHAIGYLPRTTRALVELLGFRDTLALLERHGGTKRYIPKNPASRSVLREGMSEEAFRKLCEVYCGETLELPKADSLRRALRDYEIAELTASGVSRSRLVEQYGLSQRQIGNIRRRYGVTRAGVAVGRFSL